MAVPNNSFTIRHVDQMNNKGSEKFYTTLTAEQINSDSDTAVAFDAFARAFCALSTDTYDDVIFTSKTEIDTE